MRTTRTEAMSSGEQAFFTAMTERLRQLRRRRGVPHGVSRRDAIALPMITADEVDHARWGDATSLSPQAHPSPS